MRDWQSKQCNGIIYLCKNLNNGKKYVGITRRPLETRKAGHEKAALAGRGGEGSLQEAIRKFGFNNFEFEIISRATTLGELSDRERYYIEFYNTLKPLGYNHNRGGSVSAGGEVFEFNGEFYLSMADLADYYDIYEETLRKRVAAGWTLKQATNLEKPPEIKIDGTYWEVGDLEFVSSAELCRHYNLDVRTFRARIASGWPLEQACGEVPRKRNEYAYKGHTYTSVRSMAEAYNLPYERVSSRLRLGFTIADAMSPLEVQNRYGRKAITINGERFGSMIAAANKLNLTRSQLKSRLVYLDKEKTHAKLAELPKRKYKKRPRDLTVEGRNFKTYIELSEHYKIPEGTIRSRLNRGKSIEEAVGLITVETLFPLEFDGQEFQTSQEIASHYGINRATFDYRFKKAGWSLRASLGLEETAAAGDAVKVAGQTFASKSQAARHFNIHLPTFFRRVRDGWTLEEACEVAPRNNQRSDRKIYVVTLPNGDEEVVSNLSEFCRSHNLSSYGNLHMTMTSDKHHTYKGFSLREATHNETEEYLSRNPDALASQQGYRVRHPVEYLGVSYRSKKQMCEELKISYSMFRKKILDGENIEDAVQACQNEMGR